MRVLTDFRISKVSTRFFKQHISRCVYVFIFSRRLMSPRGCSLIRSSLKDSYSISPRPGDHDHDLWSLQLRSHGGIHKSSFGLLPPAVPPSKKEPSSPSLRAHPRAPSRSSHATVPTWIFPSERFQAHVPKRKCPNETSQVKVSE